MKQKVGDLEEQCIPQQAIRKITSTKIEGKKKQKKKKKIFLGRRVKVELIKRAKFK